MFNSVKCVKGLTWGIFFAQRKPQRLLFTGFKIRLTCLIGDIYKSISPHVCLSVYLFVYLHVHSLQDPMIDAQNIVFSIA